MFAKKTVGGHKQAGYISTTTSDMLFFPQAFAILAKQTVRLQHDALPAECKRFVAWSKVLDSSQLPASSLQNMLKASGAAASSR